MSERQVVVVNLLNRLNLCSPLVRKWSAHGECITTDKPPKRPDPAIYSQLQRLSQGMTATWNNEDIQVRGLTGFQSDSIEVIVRNKSGECSAVNTLVQVKWALFGIGTVFSSLGSQVIDVGVGIPDYKHVFFPINGDIRALDSDVSIQVDISHPHDKDTSNNTGFEAVRMVLTSDEGKSPTMNFPVVNTSAVSETITLVVLANDIAATVTPTSRVYAPNEQIQATLSTIIPASIASWGVGHNIRKEATVVGYDSGGKILGGVTLLVEVDS